MGKSGLLYYQIFIVNKYDYYYISAEEAGGWSADARKLPVCYYGKTKERRL